MPNGFQWTPEDVHNAERLAEIQARANAKAYREAQERLDRDREEAEERQERRNSCSRPLPHAHSSIDADLIMFTFRLAEIKKMPENTAEEVLAKLKATASFFAEYYNKAEQEHLRAHKLPEGKGIALLAKLGGYNRVQKKVNSEAMVSINKYGVTADAVRKAWQNYYAFKEQHNL
jgi:hypothetical protein